MTIEEVRNTRQEADGYDSKDIAKVASTSASLSSTSLSEDRRGQIKPIDCAFDATEDPRYYKPIESYEGYHRWDPEFDWSEEEEKAIVKKVWDRFCSLKAFC